MRGLAWDEQCAAVVEQVRPEHPYRRMYDEAGETGRARIAEALYFLRHGIAGPRVRGPTAEIGAKVILGRRPSDLFPLLTAAEANRFCAQEDHATPEAWLWASLRDRYAELAELDVRIDRMEVLLWLQRIMTSDARRKALRRDRRQFMGEQEIAGTALERLDELMPQDLRDSVEDTLVAALERQIKDMWSGPDRLVEAPEWEGDLPDNVRLITTATGLFVEGSEMRHCAATYCERVHSGECLMWSVVGEDGERATVQTDPEGQVVQIAGFANGRASRSCRDLADTLKGFIRQGPGVRGP